MLPARRAAFDISISGIKAPPEIDCEIRLGRQLKLFRSGQATAKVVVFDVRNLTTPQETRDSPLKFQVGCSKDFETDLVRTLAQRNSVSPRANTLGI